MNSQENFYSFVLKKQIQVLTLIQIWNQQLQTICLGSALMLLCQAINLRGTILENLEEYLLGYDSRGEKRHFSVHANDVLHYNTVFDGEVPNDFTDGLYY